MVLLLLPHLSPAQGQQDWWRVFNDPEMSDLVQAALAANGNVQAGQRRVSSAQETVEAQKGYYIPNLFFDPLIQQQSLAPNRPLPISTGNSVTLTRFTLRSFNLPLDLAYDINFWLKANLVKQAKNQVRQQGANLEQTQLTIASQVAQTVIQIRTADLALAVLERNTSLLDSVQRILEARFKAGLTNESSLLLNRTQLQGLYVDVQNNTRSRAEAVANLEALTNRNGLQVSRVNGVPYLPGVDTGGAANAVLQRPDVRLYDYQLSQGRLLQEQANYNRLPRPFVAASSGFTTSQPERVLATNSFTYTVGAGIAVPIWDWRNNRFHVRAAKEKARAREAVLRQQKLDATADLRAAVANLNLTAAQLQANTTAIATAQRSIRLASELYTRGLTSFLELLQAEQIIITLQTRQANLQGQYLQYVVNYWLARGGR